MNQIILIDDDPVVLFLHHALLKRMNTESTVLSFDDGDLALAHIQSEPTASFLILLDINMPKMNGIEFLKEIRNNPDLKHLSVFMVTTSSDESDIKDSYEHNVAGYILKPVDLSEFEGTFKLITEYWKLCEFPASAN